MSIHSFLKLTLSKPHPSIDQLATFTNATLTGIDNVTTVWRSSPNVALTNNFNDFFNYSVYVAGFGLPTNGFERLL